MKLLNELWNDEAGSVVSAELVLLGTLGVVGVGVGAAAIGNSAEDELGEIAYSIRSLDQSYRVNGFHGCGAWTAGSFYTQPPVEESLKQLRKEVRRERAALEKELRDAERAREDDQRDSDREERMEDERRQEHRRRMREREMERRNEQREERWDGDDRPRRNDERREADEPKEDASF
jgi:hypothetical protein